MTCTRKLDCFNHKKNVSSGSMHSLYWKWCVSGLITVFFLWRSNIIFFYDRRSKSTGVVFHTLKIDLCWYHEVSHLEQWWTRWPWLTANQHNKSPVAIPQLEHRASHQLLCAPDNLLLPGKNVDLLVPSSRPDCVVYKLCNMQTPYNKE